MGSSAKSAQRKNHPQEGSDRVASRNPRFSVRVKFALAAVALSGLVVIAYSNSLANGFVWDDHQQIVLNPALKPDSPLSDLFASDVRFANRGSSIHTDYYRPLQLLTYRMLIGLSGASPEAFHICSVVLALCGTLAVFIVCWLLTRKIDVSFAATAIFAVYPVHTEAVDWISASPDLGCGLFVLLAFGFFLAARQSCRQEDSLKQSLPSWLRLSFSLVAFAVALLWKETAGVLPILVTLYVLIVEARDSNRWRSSLVASAPYWIVLALYLGLRVRLFGSLATGQRNWDLTPLQFLLNALHLMTSYWEILAAPLWLNAYHLFSPVRTPFDLRVFGALVFVVCAIASLIYLTRRAPLCAFSAVWVFVTLLPAMDISAVGRNALAERYLYLPSFGFCLLVTIAVASLMSRLQPNFRKPLAITTLSIVVLAFAAETMARNPDWKDDNTLFSETLRRSPDAPFVRYMVATAEGSDPDAEQNYLQAITLAKKETPPDRVDLLLSYQGIAWFYADRSDYQHALAMLSQASELAPGDTQTDTEQGLILARAGRWSEAEPLLNKAFVSQPANENVLSALGLMAWQYNHNLNRAVDMFSRALAVHSDQDDFAASLHNNLGAVYGELGDFPSAIDQFRLAIQISPADPEYHTNLASALGAANRYQEARLEAEAALRISPHYPAALAVLQNLGAK